MPVIAKWPDGIWHVSRGSPTLDIWIAAECQAKGLLYKQVKKIPSLRQLEKWSDDGICPTPDGCRVESDGTCQHGFPSWLMVLGFI